jgi:hypothetical protein
MVQVIAKNTFISLIASAEQGEFADLAQHHCVASRSRSVENVRNKTIHETLAHQSTQRLNAVRSVGLSCSAPPRHDEEYNELVGGTVSLSELRDLHQKLAEALGMKPSTPEESCQANDCKLKHIRNVSSCSLSTMAPDDASECGSLRGSGGLSRMRNVFSSGSVSTMASDWADCMSESGEDELAVEEESATTHEASFIWPDTDSDSEEVQLAIAPARHPQLEAPTWLFQPEALATTCASASTGKSQLNPEFSHGSVPRNRNWAALKNRSDKDEPPTTLMIRNVPSRFSQQDLVMELQDLGFAGRFDFLYIPMDKNTLANVGYAFVNFVEPMWAKKCMEIFQNHCFTRKRRGPAKVATVSIAHLQGLEKNLQHYENAAVNASKQTQRRPLVMTSIGKIVI